MIHPVLMASSKSEKLAIYQFRYQVYIEEMQKQHISANHFCKIQTDEADKYAILYYASLNNNVIGTCRMQEGMRGFAQKDHDYFRIGAFEKLVDPAKMAIVDRLIVKDAFRHSGLAHQLIASCYARGLEAGLRIGFISCEAKLLPMYMRYGFRLYDEPVVLPRGELRYRLLLVLEDRAHLQSVRSPFLAQLAQGRDDHGCYATLMEAKLGVELRVWGVNISG